MVNGEYPEGGGNNVDGSQESCVHLRCESLILDHGKGFDNVVASVSDNDSLPLFRVEIGLSG